MADLACGSPDPNTGVIYYGHHRYEQWLLKEVTVMANEQELSELRPAGEVIYPRGSAHVRTWDGSAGIARTVDENVPSSISSRLDDILNRLHGGCKAMEVLVGSLEEGKGEIANEPVSRIDSVEMSLKAIECRVGVLLVQIDRMCEKVG